MRDLKKYSSFIVIILIVTLYSIPKAINYEWIGIVLLFIGIIFLFEYFEKSRTARIKKWSVRKPNKIIHILIFSLRFGLAISLVITFLIYKKADLLTMVFSIYLTMVVIFGWVGLMDWESCNKEFLEEKFKVNL